MKETMFVLSRHVVGCRVNVLVSQCSACVYSVVTTTYSKTRTVSYNLGREGASRYSKDASGHNSGCYSSAELTNFCLSGIRNLSF